MNGLEAIRIFLSWPRDVQDTIVKLHLANCGQSNGQPVRRQSRGRAVKQGQRWTDDEWQRLRTRVLDLSHNGGWQGLTTEQRRSIAKELQRSEFGCRDKCVKEGLL